MEIGNPTITIKRTFFGDFHYVIEIPRHNGSSRFMGKGHFNEVIEIPVDEEAYYDDEEKV